MKQVKLQTHRCHCTKLSHHGNLVPVTRAPLCDDETAGKAFCQEVLRLLRRVACVALTGGIFSH
jgi:hypothetical protein